MLADMTIQGVHMWEIIITAIISSLVILGILAFIRSDKAFHQRELELTRKKIKRLEARKSQLYNSSNPPSKTEQHGFNNE